MKKIILGLMFILGICMCRSQTAFASESMNDTFKIDGIVYSFDDMAQSYIDNGWNYIIIPYYRGSKDQSVDDFLLTEVYISFYPADSVCGLGLSDDSGNYKILRFDDGVYVPGNNLKTQRNHLDSDGNLYNDGALHGYGLHYYPNIRYYTNSVYEFNRLIYSNKDLYTYTWNDDVAVLDTGTIFFQRMPAPMKSLPKIVKKAELAGTMSQVVRMIPIMMAVSVGYLGLRKALTILRKALFQA